MPKNQNALIKSSSPRWFVNWIIFCWVFLLLICAFYIFRIVTFYGLNYSHIVMCAFLIIITFGGVWFISCVLFHTTTATEEGIETTNPILKSKKSCTWHEIIDVRKPRLGIPASFRYAILEKNKKILLIKGIPNYEKIIELIKLRAPNLKKIGKRIWQNN